MIGKMTMKALIITLTIFSTFLSACDRQTLEGLRLRFQADIKSDYDEEKETTTYPEKSNQTASQSEEKPEKWSDQPAPEVQSSGEVQPASADPDRPLPFRPLKPCSESGIVAQTNEIFYQRHPQLKSINSKNKQQMKEWKSIQTEVEQKCASN